MTMDIASMVQHRLTTTSPIGDVAPSSSSHHPQRQWNDNHNSGTSSASITGTTSALKLFVLLVLISCWFLSQMGQQVSTTTTTTTNTILAKQQEQQGVSNTLVPPSDSYYYQEEDVVAFNFGGPNHNETYRSFLQSTTRNNTNEGKKSEHGSLVAWEKWLNGTNSGSSSINNNNDYHRPVLRLLAMTKDEWPILQDWVYYHGALLGFENLIILDGSTTVNNHSDSIHFLTHVARDTLGVTVIFTQANLNEIGKTINEVALRMAPSSHFIVKVDPDEFLVVNTGDPSCEERSDNERLLGLQQHNHTKSATTTNTEDCTLSPYSFWETITKTQPIMKVADGRRLRVGYLSRSVRNKHLCEEESVGGGGRGDDIGAFGFTPAGSAGDFKAIHDARTFSTIDLGGHRGNFLPPHDNQDDVFTAISVLHIHSRCLQHEVANTRKACISHGYIDASDSDEDALEKLHSFMGPDICAVSSTDAMAAQKIPSRHKIFFLAKYLSQCEGFTKEAVYPPMHQTGKSNPDFRQFLQDAKKAISRATYDEE